jgi:general secretion pathway protein G
MTRVLVVDDDPMVGKTLVDLLELHGFPAERAESGEQGLEALVSQPTTGKIPKNYPEAGYLDKLPDDPWGNPYVYISPGMHGEYDLESYGFDEEDGGEGKSEDIESWNLE